MAITRITKDGRQVEMKAEPTIDCRPGGVHFTCKAAAFPDHPQCPCACHEERYR